MASGHRLRSATSVLAFLVLVRWASDDAQGRIAWLHFLALPLGYGHLVGGAWLARGRIRRFAFPGLSPALFAALLAVTLANLLAAYVWALRRPALEPALTVPLLLLAAWHIVENDLALADAARSGLPPGGLRTAARHHLVALAFTLLLGGAALCTADGAREAERWFGQRPPAHGLFDLTELVAGVLMYHTVSWLFHLWSRPPRGRSLPAFRRWLLLLHALPLALGAALYVLAPPLHAWLADPMLYLFWSVLHAVQTAWARSARISRARPMAT